MALRGEIELQTIAFAFIAIVAVGLFLVFFLRAYPDAGRSAYCQLHQATNAIIFIGSRPPLPPECGAGVATFRRDLRGDTPDVARSIAQFAEDCWKRGQQGTGAESFNCYEMNVETQGTVTEGMVVADCSYLPNNLLDLSAAPQACGSENRLVWQSDVSTGFFIVKYDAALKAVVVK